MSRFKAASVTSKVGSNEIFVVSTTDQAITEGYRSGALIDGKIRGEPNLVSTNLRAGVTIGAVTGNTSIVDTSVATATALQILVGASAYVNGTLVNGAVPNKPGDNLGTFGKTITNLMPNSSFESGVAGWATGTGIALGTGGKFGTNTLSVTGSATIPENVVNSPAIPFIANHKYYTSCWIKPSINGLTTQIYSPCAGAWSSNQISVPVANTWYFNSLRTTDTTFSTGNYVIRLDNNNVNTTGNMLFDGVVVIDLTASFGAGLEPTQSQMDTLIQAAGGWFDGSIVIETISQGAYVTNGALGMSPEVLVNSVNLLPQNILDTTNILGVAGSIKTVPMDYGNHAFTSGTSVGAYSGDGHNRLYLRPKGYGVAPYYYPNSDFWLSVIEDNLIAANIASGKSIFGIAGSAPNFASGSGVTSSSALFTIRGLSFTPSVIYVYGNTSAEWLYDTRMSTTIVFRVNGTATVVATAYTDGITFTVSGWTNSAFTWKAM